MASCRQVPSTDALTADTKLILEEITRYLNLEKLLPCYRLRITVRSVGPASRRHSQPFTGRTFVRYDMSKISIDLQNLVSFGVFFLQLCFTRELIGTQKLQFH